MPFAYSVRSQAHRSDGFTLVELIVVVVIVGILASVGIPAFLSAADKAKQAEASVLASAYIRATQAYYVSHSTPPLTELDLAEFVQINGCDSGTAKGSSNPVQCKYVVGNSPRRSKYWNSASGIFNVVLQQAPGKTAVVVVPAGAYMNKGFGVIGCFNHASVSTKVIKRAERGWLTGGNHDAEAMASIRKFC